jgi:hypothetical protein
MKLTVGPLAPAVYWRRRALILGTVLVVVLLIAYSCSGDSSGDENKNNAKGTPTASASTASNPPVVSPTAPEPSYTPPVYGEGGNGGAASSTAIPGNGAPGSLCADSDLAVVPALEASPITRGAPTKVFIRIKNISGRTCVRDLGAKMQELYIERDSTRQWSSDACEDRGSTPKLVTFPPNHEESYWVTWDGKANVRDCTAPPLVPAGTYRLLGRLGTKISDPVSFQVTG